MQTLIYKLRYLRRQFFRELLMRCHVCRTPLNFTRSGKGICPDCGR